MILLSTFDVLEHQSAPNILDFHFVPIIKNWDM